MADVLVYYGEDTNVVAEYWNGHPDIPTGFSYDFCSPHALLNLLSVRDSCAVTESGMSYKAIVLGKHTRTMSLEILRKLRELVAGGVCLIGAEPAEPAGRLADREEFDRLVKDIWHSRRANVLTGAIPEALRECGLTPDLASSVDGLRFVHRVDGDKHIYWIRNFSGQ